MLGLSPLKEISLQHVAKEKFSIFFFTTCCRRKMCRCEKNIEHFSSLATCCKEKYPIVFFTTCCQRKICRSFLCNMFPMKKCAINFLCNMLPKREISYIFLWQHIFLCERKKKSSFKKPLSQIFKCHASHLRLCKVPSYISYRSISNMNSVCLCLLLDLYTSGFFISVLFFFVLVLSNPSFLDNFRRNVEIL